MRRRGDGRVGATRANVADARVDGRARGRAARDDRWRMSDDGGAREGRPRKRKLRWDADDGAAVETREIAAMGDGSRFGTGPSMVEQDAGDGPVALPDAAAIHAHLASRGVVSASAMTTLRTDDPEVTRKFAKYQDVSQRLAMRDFTDDRPESDRSPSPPPKYNRFGVKVNTREARMKDKILRERDELIEFLMERARGEFQPPRIGDRERRRGSFTCRRTSTRGTTSSA